MKQLLLKCPNSTNCFTVHPFETFNKHMNKLYVALSDGMETGVGDKCARSSQSWNKVAQLLFFIFSIFMAQLNVKCCCGLGALPLQP